LFTATQLPQYIQSRNPRQVEIQKNQDGARKSALAPAASQIVQCILAVAGHVETEIETAVVEELADDKDVGGVIFYQ